MTGMQQSSFQDALGRERLVGILRYRSGGDVLRAAEALVEGGVRVLEATIDTPGALQVIEAHADRPGVWVGAGTVVTAEEVRRVADAGARFVVSPGFVPEVVETALDLGLAPLPGVGTATEVLAARRAGAGLCKLFPAGALGLDYLRQIRGPFGDEAFVPTGGIGIADIPAWLAAGAFAVAIGGDLAGRTPPEDDVQASELAGRARRAVEGARRS